MTWNRDATPGGDRFLKVDPKPCARCRKRFKPTGRRRLLCAVCFHYANEQVPYAPAVLSGEEAGWQ